jgi:hypothetical protein
MNLANSKAVGASSSSPSPPSASSIDSMDLGDALSSAAAAAAASSAWSAASSAVAAPPRGDRLRPVRSPYRRGMRSSCPRRTRRSRRSTPAAARGRTSRRCRRSAGSCAAFPSRLIYTAGVPRPDPRCAGGCARFCNRRSTAGRTIRRRSSRRARGPRPSPGRVAAASSSTSTSVGIRLAEVPGDDDDADLPSFSALSARTVFWYRGAERILRPRGDYVQGESRQQDRSQLPRPGEPGVAPVVHGSPERVAGDVPRDRARREDRPVGDGDYQQADGVQAFKLGRLVLLWQGHTKSGEFPVGL